ncbi:lipoxygenase homology domain-containing protein 1-like isoform X2 [Ptychodera flava]|uniref:lipoxygenase homology domain-containing protein 1-like isoform X2 n=1 Tax=Ptychodera flava TaxID=63121 RepID=UPI00396A68C5
MMNSSAVKSLMVTPGSSTTMQPVKSRDPYPPYAVGRPRPQSAPLRRTAPVDSRPAWHDSRADLTQHKHRRFTVTLKHQPIESRVSRKAPYAARKYDSIDLANIKHYPRVENGQTVTLPPYSSINDPHLADYFARKFGFTPKPPAGASVTGSYPRSPRGKLSGQVTYRIEVKTGDKKNASTEANVSIWIKGTKGKMPKKNLSKASAAKKQGKVNSGVPFKFPRNKKKIFKIKSKDLGDLTSLHIEHDGLERRHSWFLEEVVVTNVNTGKSWIFPCNQWLSLFESDCQLSRELRALDGKKYGKTEYEVVTVTGDKKGAGTDANVYVTLFGQRATTKKFHLRPINQDPFERGQSDICKLTANNVGPIKKIRIEHDNTGFGPGWFLDRVVITDLKSPKKGKYYFPCHQWLAKDEGDGMISRDLIGSTDPNFVGKANKYIVRVYTGDKRNAGTDANVFITIFGELGDSGERKLDNKQNNFERGQEDKFTLESPSLGPLTKIRIGHDNSGIGPGWFLDKVIIDDTEIHRCYEFTCGRWFDKKEGDGKIQRDILIGGKIGDAPAGIPYEIRVTTSDRRHAGTSAKVYIVMHGGHGDKQENSGKIWLHGGNFERGRTDIINIECASLLSPLSRLVVGHDNSGPGSGWHLEKIEVYCPSTGITQVFICNKWLADDEGDGCIERTLKENESMRVVKKSKNIWYVSVFTGEKTAAGTDAKVSICLYGSKGKSDDIVLNNASDNFENGKQDDFKVEIPDVGKPYKLRIGHDDAGVLSGWYLRKVLMENMTTKKKYAFNCERWLARDEDDGSCIRELPAEGETIKKPQPVTKYIVRVFTGDKFNAGTDANVFCMLTGDQGDTGERPLSSSKTSKINKFERNTMDEFELEAVTLKKVRRIKIGHDGSLVGSGWYLDKVEVEEINNPASKVVFPCARWLDRDEDDGLIVRELVPEGVSQLLSTTSYHVTVKTGDERGAGTDANVYIKMFGEDGDSGQIPLKQSDNTKNKFERGRKDKFTLEASDIGKIEYMKIGHDGSKPGAGWFLDNVEIDVPSRGENYVFACHRWLAEDEGDGELEVELQPTDYKKSTPRIPYEICVKTGDVMGAGTDANVFIRMYGVKGKTEEFTLNNRTDNFERGETDKFKIEAEDVGQLTKLRIGHDNKGGRAGWYLDRVVIERFPPKRRLKRKKSLTRRRSRGDLEEEEDEIPETNKVFFVCNRWFAKDEDDNQIVRELLPTDEDGRAVRGHGLAYNEYTVHIYTGDVSGAGTDSNVFINVFGENGDTGERELKDSETNTNKFERNCEDVFKIDAVDLGGLRKVKIRHDNSMLGSAWFLDRIEIEDKLNKERFYFPCQRWLATGEDDGQISRDLVPVSKQIMEAKMKGMGKRKSTTSLREGLALETKAIMTTYYVSVETADVRGAGTDANVHLVIYGEQDDTGILQLKTSKTNKNKFERGKTDEFEVEAVDIGDIKKIRIGHDSKGPGAGWMLEKVDIDAPSLGKKWTFPCHRWFDKKEDDGETERDLLPVETRTEQYEKHVPYEITVYTSDVSGAGTDADVYVVLFGKENCTTQKSLCINKKQRKEFFERASVDKFVVELEDVGETIEKIRIGHDGSGFGAAWHLHKVEVRRLLDSGKGSKTFTFPCGRWLARKEDDGAIVRELVPTHIIEETTRKDGSVKKKEVKQDVLEKRNYKVFVYTGDVSGAGTDANVFINIYGELGDTGERKLVKSETYTDKFERGHCDKFTVEAVDLGKLYKIMIRHDNSMLGPAWFLEKVEVIDDDDTYVFHCERWLAKNKEDGKIQRNLYVKGYQGDTSSISTLQRTGSSKSLKSLGSVFGPDSPSARRRMSGIQEPEYTGPTIPYTVKITTGKESDMGTEANVFIEMIGSKKPKKTGKIPLYLVNKEKFEPKSTETFSLEAPDIGEIKQIEIGHDGVTPKDGWYVEDIEVDMPTVGKHYHFSCKRWLSKDKDDGQISRVLKGADAESVQYKPKIPYEVEFYTGDVKNAGTDAKVTMTVFGANGSTPEMTIDKAGERFERAKIDMIKMELDDIGELKKVRITTDGKGSRPEWYLEKIFMRNMETGDMTAFKCDQWFSKTQGDGKLTRDIPAMVRGETTIKNTKYTINVKTSNVRGAGTDANVFLILFGENGDSGQLELKESQTHKNKFENNQTDVFSYSMLSLGALTKCRVWHDNKGWGAAWHLEHIEVIDETTKTNYMFRCDRWLSKSEDDKQIVRELTCSGPATPGREDEKMTYIITVLTGDKRDAGTQHNAWLVMEGDKRTSREFIMENSARNKILRKGDTDEFRYTTRNVGDIETILLGHKERDDLAARGSGREVEWYCYEVAIQNSNTGDKFVFPCKSWIPMGKKGAKRLECTKKEQGRTEAIRKLAPVKYEIIVVTADEKGAGTDANVFITIYGTNGDTGKRPLTQRFRDLFERNQTDKFQIEVLDLGELTKVRIEHDNAGFNAGWLPERIEIVNQSTGHRTTFPAMKWLDKKKGDGELFKEFYPLQST